MTLNNEIEEIVLKKISVYSTSIENIHLLETVASFIETNKHKFTERTWNCNSQTSVKISKNILYDIEEFNYLTAELEKIIKRFLYKVFNKNLPFMIVDSWINILGENGYQEPHIHGDVISGVLYLTEDNSEIEFIVYPEDERKKVIPKKGDVLLFDGTTYHRVVESKHERMSLAFNLRALK